MQLGYLSSVLLLVISTCTAAPLYIPLAAWSNPVLQYSWVAEDWTTCSVTCGSGVRTRNVYCTINGDHIPMPAELCSATITPSSTMGCQMIPCTNTVPAISCPTIANFDLTGAAILTGLPYVAPSARNTDAGVTFAANVGIENNGLLFKIPLPDWSGDYDVDVVVDGDLDSRHLIFLWQNPDGYFAVRRNARIDSVPYEYAWGSSVNYTSGLSPSMWLSQYTDWKGLAADAAPMGALRTKFTVSTSADFKTAFSQWVFGYPLSVNSWSGALPAGMDTNGVLARTKMEFGIYRDLPTATEPLVFKHISVQFNCLRGQSPVTAATYLPSYRIASFNNYVPTNNKLSIATFDGLSNSSNANGLASLNLAIGKVGDWPLKEITEASINQAGIGSNILQDIPVQLALSDMAGGRVVTMSGVTMVQSLMVCVEVLGNFPTTSKIENLIVALTDATGARYFAFAKGDVSTLHGKFISSNGSFIHTANEIDIRVTDHSFTVESKWDALPPASNPNNLQVVFMLSPAGPITVRAFHGGQVATQVLPGGEILDPNTLRVQLYRGDPLVSYTLSDVFVEAIQPNTPSAFVGAFGPCVLPSYQFDTCMGIQSRTVLCTQRQPLATSPSTWMPMAVVSSNCPRIPTGSQRCLYQPDTSAASRVAETVVVEVHHVSGTNTTIYRPNDHRVMSWTRVPTKGPIDIVVRMRNKRGDEVAVVEIPKMADMDSTVVYLGVVDNTLVCSPMSSGVVTLSVAEERLDEPYMTSDVSMRTQTQKWPPA